MGLSSENPARFSLYSAEGERKYLSSDERSRFFAARLVLGRPEDITFAETLFWTGCRVSEALALTARQVDCSEKVVAIRSLKKRGANKGRHYRCVPVPEAYLERMDQVHNIQRLQRANAGCNGALWTFSRSTAWRLIKTVMEAAEISGLRASPKGLRHTFGVHAVLCAVPESRIKTWLGHEDQDTTAIYLEVNSVEDRALAQRMWAA